MRKFKFYAVVLFLSTGSVSFAQPQGSALKEVAVSSIDSIFTNFDNNNSPGCVVGVFRAGEILFAKGYGMASLEHNIALTPQSIMNLASVAKQFTALSVVLLAQRGKLSIDDPIRKYLPELPDYTQPVSIRHLLNHTSGIRDNVALLRLARGQVEGDSREVTLSMLEWQKELNFDPGENWMYNSGGYTLLAMIVERVSGRTLEEFTQQEIFEPLDMTNTSFLAHATTQNRALAYALSNDNDYQLHIPTHSLVGPAGLYTTIEDLAKWDRNFYSLETGGADGISLIQITGKLNSGQELSEGFGLDINTYRGLRKVWYDGSDPGYTSMLLRFPEVEFTVAVLCNVASATPWVSAYKVADLYLEDEFKDEPTSTGPSAKKVPLNEEELEMFTGCYLSRDEFMVQCFDVKDGKLFVRLGSAHFPLSHIGNYKFTDGFTPYILSFSEPDEEEAITASWSPNPTKIKGEPLSFERMGQSWNPSNYEISEYTGSYFCEELDATWKIVMKEEGLVLKRWGIEDQILEPLYKDAFAFRGSTTPRLDFKRKADGKIYSIEVSNNEIADIEFFKKEN